MPQETDKKKKKDSKKKPEEKKEEKGYLYEIPLRESELESILKDYLISSHKFKSELQKLLHRKYNRNQKPENNIKGRGLNGEDINKVIEKGIKNLKDPIMQENLFSKIISDIKKFIQTDDSFISTDNV